MNLLDNAIAAQMVLPEEARFVGLKAQMRAGFLVVECSNAIKDGAQGSAAAGNAIAARNNTAVAREGVVAAVGAPATVAALRSMKQEHGWGKTFWPRLLPATAACSKPAKKPIRMCVWWRWGYKPERFLAEA